MPDKSETEVLRVTSLLASAIRFSGWKQRDIEKTLGWSSGSMSRLLSGGIELKVKHIIEICQVIGFPQSRFFHAVYPNADEGGSSAARLQKMLEQMHPLEPEEEAQAAPSALDPANIERIVFTSMAKFFAEMGGKKPE